MKYLRVLAVLALGFTFPAAAAAHGVEVSDVTGQHGIRTVRFTYTDGTSMLFAKIKVFSPSSPDVPAQESTADRDGYFSFIPFENGDWRLSAEDGMGHKGEIVVTEVLETEAAAANTANAASAGKLPRLFGGVLGLSLILNIFALWHFVGGRKKGAAHAH